MTTSWKQELKMINTLSQLKEASGDDFSIAVWYVITQTKLTDIFSFGDIASLEEKTLKKIWARYKTNPQ